MNERSAATAPRKDVGADGTNRAHAVTTETRAQSGPVVETQGLCKRFGSTVAVDDLSLSIPAGGVFGLLGPNGSGKTTVLGMLLGLVAPSSGSIRLFGRNFSGGATAPLKRIGATVETPAFYPYLSGRANLRFFQGISRRGGAAEVERLLQLVDLAGRGDSQFHTYSLGMKQRLGIAYALLGDPDMVFLDEPTNGLDPAGVVQVRELIRSLSAGGRTVVLSSHLLHEAEQVCDSVAIIVHGHLVAQGSVAELLGRRAVTHLHSTDDTKAAALLRSLNWVQDVTSEDGYLSVHAPRDRAAEITKALASQGVYVTEMEPVQLSLERFFLSVTEDAAVTPVKSAAVS